MEFSTRSMHSIIEGQTDKRVSEPAANQLAQILENFSEDIASHAISLATEDGYQTVKPKHIRKALNQYKNREIQQSYSACHRILLVALTQLSETALSVN